MNTNEIISRVNQLKSVEAVQEFATDIFDTQELNELDDAILDAMESRMDELYTPSAKEMARKNLTAGYALFRKYDNKGNKPAAARQARRCKKLKAIYDSL